MAYTSIGQSAQVLAQEASSLRPGHPALASRRSVAYISGISPAERITVPGVPSGSVTLGPGKPRLVVFFATWVAETSDLRSRLLALNRYAKAARHGRLPGLVALDEGTTEPSPGAATAYLKRLGKPLAYPVGVAPRDGSPMGTAWPTSPGSCWSPPAARSCGSTTAG